jgi:hypothetical protein
MNGIISWKELIAKEKVKFGEMKKMFFNFAIGLLLEGKHSVGQVIRPNPSTLSIMDHLVDSMLHVFLIVNS